MRAVLRATRAERRNARPTAAAKAAVAFFVVFMGLAAQDAESHRNCRISSKDLQGNDRTAESCSNCEQIGAQHPLPEAESWSALVAVSRKKRGWVLAQPRVNLS